MRELIEKYLSVSVVGSWPRAPETLGLSWATGVSFVLWRQLWMGAGHQKDRAVIRSLAFSEPKTVNDRLVWL